MASPASRFAKRARKRPRRPPSKAQRLARSPRHPRGAELALALVTRRFVDRLQRAVLALPLGQYAKQRTDAAADGGGPALEELKPIIRAAVKQISKASAGVAQKAQRHSKSEFTRLGIKLKDEPGLAKQIAAWRKANVERIESLGEFEREELSGILARGHGKTVTELRQTILERFEVTRAKADLLARDQVLTLNAQISQSRAVAAGITEFYWSTSNDERVRESHEAIDGERFEYADPPEVDGENVLPGMPPNCRCVATPILPSSEEDDA